MIASLFGNTLKRLGLTGKADVASWSIPQISSLSIGEFFTTEWGAYTGSYDGDNYFLLNTIAYLKNSHFAKFCYKDTPFDEEMLETELFWKGKIVIIKVLENYVIGSFDTLTRDENNLPKTLKIILKNNDIPKMGKVFTVGVDCVIGYSDSPWLFGKQYLGVMMRIWQLLGCLYRTYLEILKNIALLNNKLTVPISTKSEDISAIQNNLLSGASVLPLNQDIMELSAKDGKNIILGFDDSGAKTKSLWENFYNIKNEILDSLGIESDSSPKKERKTNPEISVNNSIAKGVTQAELKMREKMIESFNKVFKQNAKITLYCDEESEKARQQELELASKGDKNE